MRVFMRLMNLVGYIFVHQYVRYGAKKRLNRQFLN